MKFFVNLILCFLGSKKYFRVPNAHGSITRRSLKISSYDGSMELSTYSWLVDLYVKIGGEYTVGPKTF